MRSPIFSSICGVEFARVLGKVPKRCCKVTLGCGGRNASTVTIVEEPQANLPIQFGANALCASFLRSQLVGNLSRSRRFRVARPNGTSFDNCIGNRVFLVYRGSRTTK